MTFLITFILLSLVNVIFSTVRSIVTIKSGKTIASLISGGYFAFYNVMLLYTVADFPMWQKCIITFVCNVIGVFVVKWIEEKSYKDKLWKIEFTVKNDTIHPLLLDSELYEREVPHSYISIGSHTIFNCYARTKHESDLVAELIKKYNCKYFVSESKTLVL